MPLAENVVTAADRVAALRGGSAFSVSDNGVLAYAVPPSTSVDVASLEIRSPAGDDRTAPARPGSRCHRACLMARNSRRKVPWAGSMRDLLFSLTDRRSTQLTFSAGADRHPSGSDSHRWYLPAPRGRAPGLYQNRLGEQAESWCCGRQATSGTSSADGLVIERIVRMGVIPGTSSFDTATDGDRSHILSSVSRKPPPCEVSPDGN